MVYCNYEPSDVFKNQLIEKPELQSRLAFYAMWLDAVGQTNDFEQNFIVKKNTVEQNVNI